MAKSKYTFAEVESALDKAVTLKNSDDGTKFLADDGTYKEVPSSNGGVAIDDTSTTYLDGKTILFIGDSICEGVGTSTQSEVLSNYTSAKSANTTPYSYWLAKNHPNATIINEGWGGYTLANKDGATNSICHKIDNGDFDKYKGNIDIIVIQGGINDVSANKLGFARGGYSSIRNDTTLMSVERPKTTVFPAVEYILEYFTQNFVGADVFYMSTYNVPNYNQAKQTAMYAGIAEICNHLGVKFIDCFGNIPTTSFLAGSKYYTQLHANTNVHKDYVYPLVEKALSFCTVNNVKSKVYFNKVVPMEIYLHSGKTTFDVGETFRVTNWRINANTCCENETVYTVTGNLEEYSPQTKTCDFSYDASEVNTSVPGTYPVYVSHSRNGATVQTIIPVTVTGDSVTKTLTSITATKTKTAYTEGEVLSTSDITVTAHYDDDSTKNVTSSATINSDDVIMSQANTYYINVSYEEGGISKNTQVTITVSASSSGGDDAEWDAQLKTSGSWGVLSFEPNVFNEIGMTSQRTYNVSFTLLSDKSCSISKIGLGDSNIGNFALTNVTLEANKETELTITNTVNSTIAANAYKLLVVAPNSNGATIKVKGFRVTEA